MAPNSVSNPKHLTVQSSAITTRPTTGISSVLNNAQNNNINNNTFVTNIEGGTGPLKALYGRVAPNAILNAGGRADEVRCHPGTRKEVIGRIERWRADAQDGTMGSRMIWLSGPAGAGKSAIVQTVAEDWKLRGIHAANFFFFRSDASRNHARSLVATLLYQIFDFYPVAREAVESILALKPLILEASLKEQFDQLISSTFRSIGPSLLQPIVLLVDGLDECDPEEKTSQRQILHALDVLVSQNDVPFLVLVASRVEHQIKMAFHNLSCNFDTIFLNEEYSPEKDIRLFVTAEFDRIRRTHHLAPSDANWPSAQDIYEIVKKSSGQFIYAVTVMRFISDSPATPQLSLQKIQGAARFSSKSPFSQLDALYTHILSQADDQESLKNILHAALFVSSVSDVPYDDAGITLAQCLRIQDHGYTDSIIRSCMADVAALAHYDHDKLSFYHASLTEYLKDQSRSGAYFVDGSAFDVKIVPLLFKHQLPDAIEYRCLSRLETVTLEIMRAYLGHSFCIFFGGIPYGLLIPLYDMCVRHDAVTEYKVFIYRWVTEVFLAPTDHLGGRNRTIFEHKHLNDIPYGQRSITMGQIRGLRGDFPESPDVVFDILRPESESDRHVLAYWIQDMLYLFNTWHHTEKHKRLLRQWMSWAVSNNIPLFSLPKFSEVDLSYFSRMKLQDIPYCQRYITMAQIEHINGDLTQGPNIVLDAFHRESASDAEEIRLWVQSLLQRIQREYYPHRLETYKRLIRQWISWADSNNVPLPAPQQSSNNDLPSFKWEDIPYGQMYITMVQIGLLYGDIWQNSDIVVDALRPGSTSDAEEVALWIQNLLWSINAEFAPDRLKYKQLIKQWIMWAISNNIPLVGLDDLPDARRYLVKGTMKKWTAAPLKFFLRK